MSDKTTDLAAQMQAAQEAADRAAKEQAVQEAAVAEARAAEMIAAMEAASRPDPEQAAIDGAHDEAMAVINAAIVAAREAREAMPARRQAAFEEAMRYGNAITSQVTGVFAAVEQPSWSTQEAEARAVLRGETLPDYALLPGLAEDKGVQLDAYAATVIGLADQFRSIARAAIRLRRAAEGLLPPDLDTPEKLAAAVEALRAQTLTVAADLSLTVP